MHRTSFRTIGRRLRRAVSSLVLAAALPGMLAAALGVAPGLSAAQAQGAGVPVSRPDPMDPTAPVPPLHWRSSLSAYPAWRDEPLGDWRAANDTVGRVGGWRAYAREAAQARGSAAAGTAGAAGAASAAGAAPDPAASPAPATRPAAVDAVPHGGHR